MPVNELRTPGGYFLQPNLTQAVDAAVETAALVGAAVGLAAVLSEFANGPLPAGNPLFQQPYTPMQPPTPVDAWPTQPTLSVGSDGVVTTPGGYKISQLSQYTWQITSPTGKVTKIWGDPHVDGAHKFDFQKNSVFVLGDGTKIAVNTVPWGNKGAHVTSSLAIINGNSEVDVKGIDKGKGVVGPCLQTGYIDQALYTGEPEFDEVGASNDWSFQGREILGGSTLTGLKLGQWMQPFGGIDNWTQLLTEALLGALLGILMAELSGGPEPVPYRPQNPWPFPVGPCLPPQDLPHHPQIAQVQDAYGRSVSDVGLMLKTVNEWSLIQSARIRPAIVLS